MKTNKISSEVGSPPEFVASVRFPGISSRAKENVSRLGLGEIHFVGVDRMP